MKYLGTKEAREQLHSLLTELQETGEPISIQKNGLPVATIISAEEYELFERILQDAEYITKSSKKHRKIADSSSARALYGSLRPRDKDKDIDIDIDQAEKMAKEEHFLNRKKRNG